MLTIFFSILFSFHSNMPTACVPPEIDRQHCFAETLLM